MMIKLVFQVLAAALALLVATPAQAINAQYAKKLERSGCTQVTELQGCDINKTREENAKGGFVKVAPEVANPDSGKTPYAGNWIAKTTEGATVAAIRIDSKDRVTVNGKKVKARRSDGALVFEQGVFTFTIQGDRRLKGEDYWTDFDAKTRGPIQGQ